MTGLDGWSLGDGMNLQINNGGYFGKINVKDQVTKGLLVKMPKDAKNGQYIITLSVYNQSVGWGYTQPKYGIIKLYVTTP